MREPGAMAVTKATTTDLGAANSATISRRQNIGIAAKMREVLGLIVQLIRAVGLPRAIQLLAFLPFLRKFGYWISRFSEIETTPFVDPRQFEFHEFATSTWTKVRSELETVLSAGGTIPRYQDIDKEQTLLTDDDKWHAYFFYIYGRRFDKQCDRCPDTDRLLQKIPGMNTAFFSILSPGKRINPHRGPYRGVMVYHLPLIVPDHGECGIRVRDQIVKWEEGVGIMFDDTYEHEAWNDTEQTRVVLFIDITRPIKFPFNLVNSAVIKLIGRLPHVKDALKNQTAWDRAVEHPV